MAKHAKAQTVRYPEFFLDTPPNHNPVIGTTSEDTLRNVLDSLKLIEQLLLSCEQQQLSLTEAQTWGLLTLVEGLSKGLDFELAHRLKLEGTD